MSNSPQDKAAPGAAQAQPTAPAAQPAPISSRELFKDRQVIDIDHEGRIYRLRVTQLGKLILTA
ncbi:MAG: hemin uptake protein HemP [Gammaproteobacteria bacterium]